MNQIGYRQPMKARGDTYATTNIKSGGGGYDPQGKLGGYGLVMPYEVAGMSFAPFIHGQDIGSLAEHFYDNGNKIANRKKKAPYNAEYNNVRREPGVYPLAKPGPQGYGNQVERANYTNDGPNVYEFPADLIAAVGILDRQTALSEMPHQWLRAPVEQDTSQRAMTEFFDDVSSRSFHNKIEQLRAKGYGDEEIKKVIEDMRRRDIEKDLAGPSHGHLRYEDMREMALQPSYMHDTTKRDHPISGGFEVHTRYR